MTQSAGNSYASLDDGTLVRRTLAGSDRAFEELIGRHKSRIMMIVSRYARDGQEIDEMAQDTFVKAYFALSGYRFQAPFENWLSRIAARTAIDHLRKRKRKKEIFFSRIDGDEGRKAEEILAPREESGSQIRQRELRDLLETVLDRLSSKEHFLITAKELEGRTVKELRDITGWSESSIKVTLYRARKKMRKILEEEYEKF